MKLRKLIALISVFSMLFATILPTYAIEDDSLSFDADIENQMCRILSSVVQEKEYYGLENVDYKEVEIGKKILTYQLINGELCTKDLYFVPIIDKGKIVSLFYVFKNDRGEICVQLSNDLVGMLNKYAADKAFAIIYDDFGVYLYTETELRLLGKSELNTQEDTLSVAKTDNSLQLVINISETEFEQINCQNVVLNYTLNIEEYTSDLTVPYADNWVSSYLPVEIIQQPSGTSICWAIAITSIANYIYDGDWTYSQIVQLFTMGVDVGQTISQVISNFNAHFEADYTYKVATTLDPQFVLEQLMDRYPLYGAFMSTSGNGHAVVIRGVSTLANSFSVMNPTPTTSGYTTGTISSSGAWSFVSAYSGSAYSLFAYGYYYGNGLTP